MNTKVAWYVYLIRTRLNSLYCGVTTDVERRFNEHQSNSTKTAKYLRGKQPLHLAWQYKAINKRQAMTLEAKIKMLTKKQKEQLCNSKMILDDLLIGSMNGKESNSV